jgi:hypothetical protein
MIYGTGRKDLGKKYIPNEKCPNCDEQNKIHVYGLAKYFHVLWIPTFPYSKKIIPICDSCNTEITKKKISTSLKEKIGLEKSFFKMPISLFSGLIVIACIIAWLSYENKKHKEFVTNRINHLESKDIMTFKYSNKEYSFAIVDSVVNNIVFFRNSNYVLDQKPTVTDYKKGLREKKDFFNQETRIYYQNEIDSLNNIGELDIFEK